MSAQVENGRRVALDHPSAEGLAGLVRINGRIELAYLANRKPPPAFGDELTIDGERFRVLSVAALRKPTMVKLGLAPIAA